MMQARKNPANLDRACVSFGCGTQDTLTLTGLRTQYILARLGVSRAVAGTLAALAFGGRHD